MRAESKYCNYHTSCLLRITYNMKSVSGKMLFFWFSNAVIHVPKHVGVFEDVDIVLIILN